MSTKTCSTCGEDKDVTDFGNNKSKKDGKQCYCKSCGREAQRKHYETNDSRKQQVTSSAKKNKQRNFDFITDYLSKHPCVDCGEPNPILLDFDHVRGTKLKNVSQMIRGHSLEKLQDEVLKCEVRCVRCHRLRTAKQFGWLKALR